MVEPRLIVEALTAGYKPGFPILHGVNASVGTGEIVSMIGPNGAGKSTLVKAIAGLVFIDAGTIRLDGRDITGISPDRMAEYGIAYVPQTNNIFRSLTVEKNLVLAAQRIRDGRAAAVARQMDIFPPLREARTLKAGGLSGGQRQMLAIAMALISDPALVLMDEPTAGLSPKVAQDVLALIQEVAARSVSVLLVEQNAKAALRISDRGYVLAEGRNQHEGAGPALLVDPVIADIYLGAWRRESA